MDEMKKRGATPNKSLFRRIAESEFFHNYKRSPAEKSMTPEQTALEFLPKF